MKLNMSNAKGGFEPIPAGAYPVAVAKIEQKIGKDSGNPYLNWEFIIQSGDFTGRKLWTITSLTEQSLWIMKQLIEAITGEEIPTEEIDFDPDDYLGKELTVTVDIENYQGKDKNVVKTFLPLVKSARKR